MKAVEKWKSWDLRGLCVTQLTIDSRFTISIWARDRELQLILETPFQFKNREGQVTDHDPEDVNSIATLLDLLNLEVIEFRVSSEGRCTLYFRNGMELRARLDESFEAWKCYGRGSLASVQLLCGPGGGQPWR